MDAHSGEYVRIPDFHIVFKFREGTVTIYAPTFILSGPT